MKIIAVMLTALVGYMGCLVFVDSELPSIFSIATMGYFVLKKLEEIHSEKK